MSYSFSIEDHCFVPPHYDSDDMEYKDCCGYIDCGNPEIEHLWTVEARMNNRMALEGKDG